MKMKNKIFLINFKNNNMEYLKGLSKFKIKIADAPLVFDRIKIASSSLFLELNYV